MIPTNYPKTSKDIFQHVAWLESLGLRNLWFRVRVMAKDDHIAVGNQKTIRSQLTQPNVENRTESEKKIKKEILMKCREIKKTMMKN